MPRTTVTQDEVIARTAGLPSFPRIVTEILASLDDPECNLNELSDYIAHDPVITARVLSAANRAANRAPAIRDVYTAASLIGLSHVRQISLLSSIGQFAQIAADECLPSTYWTHSVAVGVCAEELAVHVAVPIDAEAALIAGLLHDIGQLWLFRFRSDAFAMAMERAFCRGEGIENAEREQFDVDHARIGAWLAEHWKLPPAIVSAIDHHHKIFSPPNEPLAPLIGVAEVLASALDLGGRRENKVTAISSSACTSLGIVFNEKIQPLFGRIEARSQHANRMFATGSDSAHATR
ncbi:MAG: HDOD domain-containing protein [Gammaproteobacteria bacterium]|nr:HDOD domain-containing protein [Gammaproteobacteria bacterium]MBU1602747.1 HDOD domain-containing protein [Gammaproteobacteria bacterium]MBU2432419.1 HDOD domain-containing protein [Gammaproteobacteria bacterium]MBU2449079.1 HDOD domain-containing protein [Gammaproteobacteria bacterium]